MPVPMFDPWPHLEGVAASQLTDLQQLQLAFARDLDEHRPTTGMEALQAMVQCVGNCIAVPDWLSADVQRRLQAVNSHEVATLDDPRAFGPVPGRHQDATGKRDQLKTAHRRHRWQLFLECAFSPHGKLPRTDDGYEKAAAMTGGELSPKQVRELLPPTRENTPASERYASEREADQNAHDPFSLAKKPPF